MVSMAKPPFKVGEFRLEDYTDHKWSDDEKAAIDRLNKHTDTHRTNLSSEARTEYERALTKAVFYALSIDEAEAPKNFKAVQRTIHKTRVIFAQSWSTWRGLDTCKKALVAMNFFSMLREVDVCLPPGMTGTIIALRYILNVPGDEDVEGSSSSLNIFTLHLGYERAAAVIRQLEDSDGYLVINAQHSVHDLCERHDCCARREGHSGTEYESQQSGIEQDSASTPTANPHDDACAEETERLRAIWLNRPVISHTAKHQTDFMRQIRQVLPSVFQSRPQFQAQVNEPHSIKRQEVLDKHANILVKLGDHRCDNNVTRSMLKTALSPLEIEVLPPKFKRELLMFTSAFAPEIKHRLDGIDMEEDKTSTLRTKARMATIEIPWMQPATQLLSALHEFSAELEADGQYLALPVRIVAHSMDQVVDLVNKNNEDNANLRSQCASNHLATQQRPKTIQSYDERQTGALERLLEEKDKRLREKDERIDDLRRQLGIRSENTTADCDFCFSEDEEG